jgi:SAM-dependent methyltransferase
VDLAELPFSEACERNRGPILAILRTAFADRSRVLEIGSGTGQHAVYFAASMPWLQWQPSERRPLLKDLGARIALQGTPNLLPPLELDVADRAWTRPTDVPPPGWDAVFTANTLHIVSQSEVEQLFLGARRALGPRALLAAYGPFRYRGHYTSDSNARFDAMLRARDPDSGIRDAEWVDSVAGGQGFTLLADHAMPANNQLRLWRRGA